MLVCVTVKHLSWLFCACVAHAEALLWAVYGRNVLQADMLAKHLSWLFWVCCTCRVFTQYCVRQKRAESLLCAVYGRNMPNLYSVLCMAETCQIFVLCMAETSRVFTLCCVWQNHAESLLWAVCGRSMPNLYSGLCVAETCRVFILCHRNVLQPDVLEEHVMSVVMKHLSLMDTVRHLSAVAQQQSEDYILLSSVVDEVYRRFDVLLRQLQVSRLPKRRKL